MTKKIKTINDRLNNRFKENKNLKLNFCHLFKPSKSGKISFIGEYDKDKKYITLKDNGNHLDIFIDEDEDKFYGVSTSIDSKIIIDAISKGELSNKEKLEEFIKKYAKHFKLYEGQEKYLLAFAKLSVLSIASNFGIKIIDDKGIIPKEILDKFENDLLLKKENNTIILKGCPTDELFKELNKYKYIEIENKYSWKLSKEEGISFNELIKKKDNIILTKGKVFYSGALLKVNKIKEIDRLYGNDDIASAIIYFDKSSYGTVFTLDNNYTNHVLLTKEEKELLHEFYKYDDELRIKLKEDLNKASNAIEEFIALNNYLDKSNNVNQLGVSGNIITSDDMLLFTIRNSETIDSGDIYPSVNGNCELIDDKVEFYKYATSEDYPTIRIGQDRIDFYDELCREAYAELSLSLEDNDWYCYGIAISGYIREEEVNYNNKNLYRRMHFNIICEQHTDKTFEQIYDMQKYSTEAFENKEVKAIKLYYYKNIFDFLIRGLLIGISKFISNNIPILMSFVALYALYESKVISLDLITGTASAILIIAAILKSIKNYLYYSKLIIRILAIGKKHLLKRIEKRFSKQTSHPVSYASLISYYDNLNK